MGINMVRGLPPSPIQVLTEAHKGALVHFSEQNTMDAISMYTMLPCDYNVLIYLPRYYTLDRIRLLRHKRYKLFIGRGYFHQSQG